MAKKCLLNMLPAVAGSEDLVRQALESLPSSGEGVDLVSEILTTRDADQLGQQIEDFLRANAQVVCGRPEGIALIGQAPAASMMLPALEMMGGLPRIMLMGFGEGAKVLGWLDLADYRHNVVRPHRALIESNEVPFAGWTVLDSSGRGLVADQLTKLAESLGVGEDAIRVLDVGMGQVDFACPQEGMVEKLLGLGLSRGDWTSGRLIHLPAGSGLIAAVMATTIHGLSESWPFCLRIVRDPGGSGQFILTEVLDCQGFRQTGALIAEEDRDNQVLRVRVEIDPDQREAFVAELQALCARYGVTAQS